MVECDKCHEEAHNYTRRDSRNTKYDKNGDIVVCGKCAEYCGNRKYPDVVKEGDVIEKWEVNQRRALKNSCIITTAIVQEAGQPDDCLELTVMREFRDNHLLKTEEGRTLVNEYYRTAPSIVDAIDKRSDRSAIYAWMRTEYLNKAVKLMQDSRPEEALALYKNLVGELSALLATEPSS